MATTTQLRADITKLKKAIASKFTPKSAKSKLEAQLKKVEKELADKKSGKKTASTTASTQATFKSLRDLVRRTKELKIYKGSTEGDLQNDAERSALPSSKVKGRRISKGLRSNQFGDKKSNKGNVYYEYRKNRIDVKQPRSKQKYPILEDGGYTSKRELNKDYKRIIQAPKHKNSYEQSEGSIVGKYVTIKLPTQVNSFRMKVKNEYKDMVSGGGANGGVYDKKYIISKEDGGIMAKRGMSEKPIPAIMDDYGNIKSEKKLQQDLKYLKEAYENKLITKDEYDKDYNEIKEQIKFLQTKEKGGMMAKGGTTTIEELGSMSFKNHYDDWEMVIISKGLEKDGGQYIKDRYLVSAKDIEEAKKIATELWEKEMGNSDFHIVKVMSDSLYRMKYMDKYANGGVTDVVYSVGNYDTISGFTSRGGSKSGYPVYATRSGYPKKTLYVYETKKQAQAKVESLKRHNKMADGGMMAKGGEVLDTFKSSNNISNREVELRLIKSKDSYDIYRYHSNGERTYVGSAKDEKTARNIFNQEIVYYTEKFADGGMMAKGGQAGDIKIGTPLTENNIDGAIIMNIEHPEWGTWRVLRKYDDRIWEIRSDRSTTTLFLSEFKFWKRINYSQGGMAEMEMPNGGGIQSSTHKLTR